jgi:hypothetical protein
VAVVVVVVVVVEETQVVRVLLVLYKSFGFTNKSIL